MKTKRIVFIGLGVLVGIASILAGCQLWSRWPEVYQGEVVHPSPYQKPFSLKEKGSSVEILVRVGREKSLEVGLVALRDNKWDYGDENWMRFRALIPGGQMWQKPDGMWVTKPENLKPFKLRVQIDSIEPNIGLHVDEAIVVSQRSFTTWSKTHALEFLDGIGVWGGATPGIYRVRITNLEARPDVDWIPMEIYIGHSTGHKP